MVSYVDQRLKVIQAASADPEVAQKGQAFAKEKALQKLMSSIHLHSMSAACGLRFRKAGRVQACQGRPSFQSSGWPC